MSSFTNTSKTICQKPIISSDRDENLRVRSKNRLIDRPRLGELLSQFRRGVSWVLFQFDTAYGESRLPAEVETSVNGRKSLNDFLSESDTVAFLAIKNAQILMEHYYRGYNASRPTHAFSMSISSVDQAVTEFVPEVTAAGFDKVTTKHLLQMTSGMNCVEAEGKPFSRHNRFYYAENFEKEIDRRFVEKRWTSYGLFILPRYYRAHPDPL